MDASDPMVAATIARLNAEQAAMKAKSDAASAAACAAKGSIAEQKRYAAAQAAAAIPLQYDPTAEQLAEAQRQNPGTVNPNSPLVRLNKDMVVPQDYFFALYTPSDAGRYAKAKQYFEGRGLQIGGGATAAPGTTGTVSVNEAGVAVPNAGRNERASNQNFGANLTSYSLIAGSPVSGFAGQNLSVPRATMPFQPEGMITIKGMGEKGLPSFAIPTASLATNNPWDPKIINTVAAKKADELALAAVQGRAGFDPAFGLTMQSASDNVIALEKAKNAAMARGDVNQAFYYQNQQQKAARNLEELSSSYHSVTKRMGISLPANRYEAVGDLATEYLKGTPTKDSERFSPISGMLLGVLPSYKTKAGTEAGLGVQQDAWNQAQNRDAGKGVNFTDFSAAALYLGEAVKAGFQGPYADLYGGKNFKGVTTSRPLGEGVTIPTFQKREVPGPTIAGSPPVITAPTKAADRLVGSKTVAGTATVTAPPPGAGFTILGIGKDPGSAAGTPKGVNREYQKSGFLGLGGLLPEMPSSEQFKMFALGWSSKVRADPVKATLEYQGSLLKAPVSSATGIASRLSFGLSEVVAKPTTVQVGDTVYASEWDAFVEGSGRVGRHVTKTPLAKQEAYFQTIKNDPSLAGEAKRGLFYIGTTIVNKPAELAPAAVIGVATSGASAMAPSALAKVGAGSGLTAKAAQFLQTPGGANLAKAGLLGLFGGAYTYDVTDKLTATPEKTKENIYSSVPALAAMYAGAGGMNWIGEIKGPGFAARQYGRPMQNDAGTLEIFRGGKKTIDVRETVDLSQATVREPAKARMYEVDLTNLPSREYVAPKTAQKTPVVQFKPASAPVEKYSPFADGVVKGNKVNPSDNIRTGGSFGGSSGQVVEQIPQIDLRQVIDFSKAKITVDVGLASKGQKTGVIKTTRTLEQRNFKVGDPFRAQRRGTVSKGLTARERGVGNVPEHMRIMGEATDPAIDTMVDSSVKSAQLRAQAVRQPFWVGYKYEPRTVPDVKKTPRTAEVPLKKVPTTIKTVQPLNIYKKPKTVEPPFVPIAEPKKTPIVSPPKKVTDTPIIVVPTPDKPKPKDTPVPKPKDDPFVRPKDDPRPTPKDNPWGGPKTPPGDTPVGFPVVFPSLGSGSPAWGGSRKGSRGYVETLGLSDARRNPFAAMTSKLTRKPPKAPRAPATPGEKFFRAAGAMGIKSVTVRKRRKK